MEQICTSCNKENSTVEKRATRNGRDCVYCYKCYEWQILMS